MTLAEYLDQPGITSVALGRKLGVAHTTVLRWRVDGVPTSRVRDVCAATGLSAGEVRPDLAAVFAPAEASAA